MANLIKNEENTKWTKRKCMPCGKMFDSWGIGNRICNKCKTTSEYKDFSHNTTTVKIR